MAVPLAVPVAFAVAERPHLIGAPFVRPVAAAALAVRMAVAPVPTPSAVVAMGRLLRRTTALCGRARLPLQRRQLRNLVGQRAQQLPVHVIVHVVAALLPDQ